MTSNQLSPMWQSYHITYFMDDFSKNFKFLLEFSISATSNMSNESNFMI